MAVDSGDPATQSKGPGEKFCSNCGDVIDEKAEICPECGVRITSSQTATQDTKSPGIAAIASFFLPGLGQIYNGQIGKGLLIMVFYIIMIFMLVSAPTIAMLLIIAIWLGAIYDGYTQAEKHNRGEDLDF